jgi:hypothetical protein
LRKKRSQGFEERKREREKERKREREKKRKRKTWLADAPCPTASRRAYN